MHCKCGGDTKVVDVRPVNDRLRRRRSCMVCGVRFNTFEVLESELTPNELPKTEPKLKEKTPFVPKKTVQEIKKRKVKARHFIEDMKYRDKLEEDDLFWNGDYQDEFAY